MDRKVGCKVKNDSIVSQAVKYGCPHTLTNGFSVLSDAGSDGPTASLILTGDREDGGSGKTADIWQTIAPSRKYNVESIAKEFLVGS
jgi:hypothetical protein